MKNKNRHKHAFVFLAVLILVFILFQKTSKNPEPTKTTPQISKTIRDEIRNKIDILSLKHNLSSPACKKALLRFYWYQNSGPVMDGDVPYPEMTADRAKSLSLKNGCIPSALAAIVSDYEAWSLNEERLYRYDDQGVIDAGMARDEF